MQAIRRIAAATACLAAASGPATARPGQTLDHTSRIEASIASGQVDRYSLVLKSNESADLVVLQQGVDLPVDLISPAGKVITTVDSPDGREGPEPLTIRALPRAATRSR